MSKLETLRSNLAARFGDGLKLVEARGELTLEVPVDQWVDICTALRDQPELAFETAIDLCGVD